MTGDRLKRVEELYHAALERPSDARAAFIQAAAGEDVDLVREVESLLAHAGTDADTLFSPIGDAISATFAARLQPGAKLGPYTIVDFLGAGGMGEVYRARDPRLQRDVAIKVLPASGSDPDRQRRLLGEARAAGALNHPNILTVYDVGVQDDTPFVVSELLVGETLRQTLASGPVSVSRAVDLALEIARGVAAAHEHGIVHRDLKPENLFLSRDGRLKILDFGLARRSSKPSGPEAPTVTELRGPDAAGSARISTMRVGTAGYMAPEQIRGEPIDHRADFFAIGAIVYEMTTGRRAFDAPTGAAAIEAALTGSQPPLEAYAPTAPVHLGQIVRRCLEKAPADRYASAADLLADLTAVQSELSAAGRPASGSRRRTLATMAVSALVVGLMGAWAGRWMGAAGQPAISGLAVLPLNGESSDQTGYFADGITDALISSLARLGNVRVISRTSSMSFKGTKKSLPAIADELGVDAIVEGSVRHGGGRVRVDARLVRARTDELLWSNSYERDEADVLALEREIAQTIAAEIRATLSSDQQAGLGVRARVHPAAHEAYLRGRYFFNRGSEADLQQALKYFTEAVSLDSAFAAPHAGLSDVYAAQRSVYLPPRDVMPKARTAAATALSLDPLLGEAHVSMANVHMYYDFDWPAAERSYKRAIELSPNLASAHEYYALYLAAVGRHDEARREAERARSLDPLSLWVMMDAGWVRYLARDYQATIRANESALALDPNFWPSLRDVGLAYEKVGRYDEAITALKKARTIDNNSTIFEMLAGAYATAGRLPEARAVLDELMAEAGKRYVCPYELATMHMALGDRKATLRELDRGVDERADCMPWAAADPKLDPLRDDPAFARVLARIGLKPR